MSERRPGPDPNAPTRFGNGGADGFRFRNVSIGPDLTVLGLKMSANGARRAPFAPARGRGRKSGHPSTIGNRVSGCRSPRDTPAAMSSARCLCLSQIRHDGSHHLQPNPFFLFRRYAS